MVKNIDTLTVTASDVERIDNMPNIAEQVFDVLHKTPALEETHMLDLMSQIVKLQGVTMLRCGYTSDGIMADIRYSVDHKDYVIEIKEKK